MEYMEHLEMTDIHKASYIELKNQIKRTLNRRPLSQYNLCKLKIHDNKTTKTEKKTKHIL